MKVNYKEGMFLGKEEMERRALIESSLADSYAQLVTASYSLSKVGLLNCYKLGVNCMTGANPYVYLGISSTYGGVQSNLGRAIIGIDKNGNRIGLPCEGAGWAHAFDEVAVDISEMVPGTTYHIALKAASTHYENALISVSSSGVGTFPVNGSKVIGLFRQGTTGRHSKIQLENGTVLTVASVDIVNNTVQFEGASFSAVSNMKFMFVQTLSPFVLDNPEPLYTYPSAEVVIRESVQPDGLSFVIGTMESGEAGGQVFILKDNNSLPYTWLDTVGDNQIKTSHIQNFVVTSAKIQNQAITKGKLAVGAFGYRKLLTDDKGPGKILRVEPGSIITNYYNDENPYNLRFIEAYSIGGITVSETYMMPAKVIMEPNSYTGVPSRELKSYFQDKGTTDYGANFLLDVDMNGVVPDSEHLCVFDFYWQSANKVFVQFKYVNLNW